MSIKIGYNIIRPSILYWFCSIEEYFGQVAGGEVIAHVPVAYHIIELLQRAQPVLRGATEFCAVAQDHAPRGVRAHRIAQYVFVLETVVNFSVRLYRLRGNEGDIGTELPNGAFGVFADQYRIIDRRDEPARGISGDLVAREQGEGVDPVGHDLDVFISGKIFGDKESRSGTVQKNEIAVIDKSDRRKGDLFLFQAVLMRTEGETREKIVFVVDLYAAVYARDEPLFLQGGKSAPHGGGADEQLLCKFADVSLFFRPQQGEDFFVYRIFHFFFLPRANCAFILLICANFFQYAQNGAIYIATNCIFGL